jgi:hypothetical protein
MDAPINPSGKDDCSGLHILIIVQTDAITTGSKRQDSDHLSGQNEFSTKSLFLLDRAFAQVIARDSIGEPR